MLNTDISPRGKYHPYIARREWKMRINQKKYSTICQYRCCVPKVDYYEYGYTRTDSVKEHNSHKSQYTMIPDGHVDVTLLQRINTNYYFNIFKRPFSGGGTRSSDKTYDVMFHIIPIRTVYRKFIISGSLPTTVRFGLQHSYIILIGVYNTTTAYPKLRQS